MKFKTNTEERTYRWLLERFQKKDISFPDKENKDSRKPDFKIALDGNNNLIVECKEIGDISKLENFEFGNKKNHNLFTKFQNYSQLKPQFCGNKNDIRILVIGSKKLFKNRYLQKDSKSGVWLTGKLPFLLDALFGTKTEFKIFSNGLMTRDWIGTMKTTPSYISAIGFLYGLQGNLYIDFERNKKADVVLSSDLLNNCQILDSH